MVQFQKPKKIYSDRRLFFGGCPPIVPTDSFGPVSSTQNTNKRGGRGRGYSFVPPGPPNGSHKPGMHPAGHPLTRFPLPPFPEGPHSQPYAIPTRGAVHGPIGAVPHVPQSGNRGFGTGRGNAGGPIGDHLAHQDSSQQSFGSIGPIGSAFNFPPLDNPNSQPSIGTPLSQTGLMTQVPIQGLSQTIRDGYSIGGMSQDFLGDDFKSQGSHVAYNVGDFSTQASQGGGGYGVDYVSQGPQGGYPGSYLNQNSMPGYSHLGSGNDFISQDYMPHGSHGLFTQARFNDPLQDESSQSHFAIAGPVPLQSQAMMNPLYSQPFTQYNTQVLSLHAPQQQQQQNQKVQYSG